MVMLGSNKMGNNVILIFFLTSGHYNYNMIPEEPEWQIVDPKLFENKNSDETVSTIKKNFQKLVDTV